jgi:hypothetical protein
MSTPVALQKILKDASLQSAAIIDDAFDPVVAQELQSEIAQFIDHCRRNSLLAQEIATFCKHAQKEFGLQIDIKDTEDFTDEVLIALRNSLHLYPIIRGIASETIFALLNDKLAPLVDLQTQLIELGVQIKPFGSTFVFGEFRPQIIFLDFFLGVTDDETAVQNARARITEIYQLYEDETKKPFVVLMSSRDVGDRQRTFSRDANLLYGLLTFVPKGELRSRDYLYYHLAGWSLDLPSRHAIQLFVEALESSLKESQNEFSRRLRGLGIEDYANLQWLSLQEDGHPLGDYMLWLLKEMLAHLIHNNQLVLNSQRSLDALHVERFLPSTTPPSMDLAEMYKMVLTEPGFKPADRHPSGNIESDDFYLKFGDMFFNEEVKEVLMALSAPCDLAYSPKGSSRKFPKERLILFARGRLRLSESSQEAASMKTEPFLHDDGKIYRICWKHKDALWIEYGHAKETLSAKGFVHKTQMSLPYALEIQKSYANNISRIGLPVHPPINSWHKIDICCVGVDDKWKVLRAVERGAQLVTRRVGDGEVETLFVLCREAVLFLPEAMSAADKIFEQTENELRDTIRKLVESNDANKTKKIERANTKLSSLSDKRAKIAAINITPQACLPLILTPRVLDTASPHVVLGADLPWLFVNADYSGTFRADTPLAINLRRSEQ